MRVESAGIGHGSVFVVTLPLLGPVPEDDESSKRSGRRSGKVRRTDPVEYT